jgi:uncharacterized damage-inducible protein DinB
MEDIQPIVIRLGDVRRGLLAVAEEVPAEKWRATPGRGGWSAAELFTHLTMVEGTIVGRAEKIVEQPPRPVPLWMRLHLPPRVAEYRFWKRESPIPLDPSLVTDKAATLERFAALRQRTLAFLDANRERDLSPWRYPHPFFGSLNLYSWFRLLYHHEIRHTNQLREIVQSL